MGEVQGSCLFCFLLSLERVKRVFSVRGKPGFRSRAVSVSYIREKSPSYQVHLPEVVVTSSATSGPHTAYHVCLQSPEPAFSGLREKQCFLRPSRTLGTGSQSREYKDLL